MNKDENKLLKKIIYKNVWIIIIKFEMKIKNLKVNLNLAKCKKNCPVQVWNLEKILVW